MTEDFDRLKKQLKELADVLNSFKSEAVQLRVVDLLLARILPPESGASDRGPQAQPRHRRSTSRATRNHTKSNTGTTKSTTAARPGGKKMLDRLINDGFFKQPRTIKDIVEHCKQRLAFTYRSSDFSGPLGRLTRDGVLKREKNANDQYEYTQIQVNS